MSSGYRNIFIAAFGVVLLGAALPPDEREQAKQVPPRQPQQTVSGSPPEKQLPNQHTNEPPGYQSPCHAGVDDRNSDLCAQWKAADAADRSAYWTLVSTIIGCLTFAAASVAAYYAREAARHTKAGAEQAERGADAAVSAIEKAAEANVIALDSQRPWITISDVSQTTPIFENTDQSIYTYRFIEINNVGEQPAVKIVGHAWLIDSAEDQPQSLFRKFDEVFGAAASDSSQHLQAYLMRGEPHRLRMRCELPVTDTPASNASGNCIVHPQIGICVTYSMINNKRAFQTTLVQFAGEPMPGATEFTIELDIANKVLNPVPNIASIVNMNASLLREKEDAT